MVEPQQAPRWWQTRLFVIAATLIAIIPLLRPEIPPLVDLPGHMGRFRVQIAIADHPFLKEWYDFNWSLIGNLGIDLLIIPMAKLFGLELGVKLIVMAIPALMVSGLLWIAREVHGRIPATALFALPLAYSYPFHFGFVNFELSMVIALNLFALWLRMARLGHVRLRAAIFVPISCLLWLCHTFGWGTLGVLAFSAELIRQHDAGHRWYKALIRAGLACVPLALPMALMIFWRSGDHVGGQTTDWFNWRAKIGWMVMVFRDRWELLDIASVAVVLMILVRAVRDPSIQYSRNLGLSAAFLLLVYILLPRIVFGSAYADMRLVPFMLAMAVIAIRPKTELSVLGTWVLATLGLTFFLVRIAATTASFWIYAQTYERELKALDHVPVGARLVSFVGEKCYGDWTASRLEHLPAIALERKMAYSNDQWSMAGAQLLTTQYAKAKRYAHDPSEIVTAVQCPREWWRPISTSLARFPRDAFDYVWLIQPPAYDPRLATGLVEIWRDGTSVLYKVDHSQPGPVVSDVELRAPVFRQH